MEAPMNGNGEGEPAIANVKVVKVKSRSLSTDGTEAAILFECEGGVQLLFRIPIGGLGLLQTLAGELRGAVVAGADGPRQVVEVVLVDAPVPAGGARAGQEAGGRPPPHGDRGDAEPARRLLDAQ